METGAGNKQQLSETELYETVDKKIALGESLKKKLDLFKHIEGALKIQRKINQEIRFLQKVILTLEYLPSEYSYPPQESKLWVGVTVFII